MPDTNPTATPAAKRHRYEASPKERLRAVTEAMTGLTRISMELRQFERAARSTGSLLRVPYSVLEDIAEEAGKLERTLRFARNEIHGETGAVAVDLVQQAQTLESEGVR